MDSYPSRAYGIPQCVRRHRQQCFAVRLRVLRQQDQHLVGPLRLKRQQVRGIDGTPELNERIKGRLNHRKLRRIAAQNAAGQFTQRRELRNEAGGLVLKMVFSGQVCAPGLLAVSRRLQQLRGFGGSLELSRGERLELLREGCRHRQDHQNQAGHLADVIIGQARFARGSGSWRTRARSKTHRKLLKARPGGLRGRRRPRVCPTEMGTCYGELKRNHMRTFFLFLSRQKHLRKWMETSRWARRLAARFVAGDNLPDALATCQRINAEGIAVTLDHLGENVTSLEEAAASRDAYLRALTEIAKLRINGNVSLKLTQFGMDLSRDECRANVEALVRHADELCSFVRVDMESSEYTDRSEERRV